MLYFRRNLCFFVFYKVDIKFELLISVLWRTEYWKKAFYIKERLLFYPLLPVYCQFHCEWFLQISKGEKSKSIPPSDKADSLGVRLELMKEGQHHRNESADWSELLRSLYLCRILTPTKFRRWKEETGQGVYFLISLSLRFVKTICNEIDNTFPQKKSIFEKF